MQRRRRERDGPGEREAEKGLKKLHHSSSEVFTVVVAVLVVVVICWDIVYTSIML